jgi:predicted nucleic acid-binding protein
VLYLDASAITKLATPERWSVPLERRVLDAVLASSAVARTEVSRALHRGGVRSERLPGLLDSITLVDVDRSILELAAVLEPPQSRTLDAIHLATALSLGAELEAFITYDRQQARAAEAAGLSVEAPR